MSPVLQILWEDVVCLTPYAYWLIQTLRCKYLQTLSGYLLTGRLLRLRFLRLLLPMLFWIIHTKTSQDCVCFVPRNRLNLAMMKLYIIQNIKPLKKAIFYKKSNFIPVAGADLQSVTHDTRRRGFAIRDSRYKKVRIAIRDSRYKKARIANPRQQRAPTKWMYVIFCNLSKLKIYTSSQWRVTQSICMKAVVENINQYKLNKLWNQKYLPQSF